MTLDKSCAVVFFERYSGYKLLGAGVVDRVADRAHSSTQFGVVGPVKHFL